MRIALLAALLIAFSAEAQTYSKIVSEGTAVSAPVVTIPAGQTYRWGIGTKWCDPVTVSGSASALPSLPQLYLDVSVDGTT